MARVLKGSHSFTCTPRVHPLTEWTIPAFAFTAEAGTHLPTPEGWKAELALGGWLVMSIFYDLKLTQTASDADSYYCTSSAARPQNFE